MMKLLVFTFSLFVIGCGVRGDPQAPLTPPELGRGQPTFKRATEGYAFPEVPSAYAAPEIAPSPTPVPSPVPFPATKPTPGAER